MQVHRRSASAADFTATAQQRPVSQPSSSQHAHTVSAGAAEGSTGGSSGPGSQKGGLRGMLGSVGSAVLPGFWGAGSAATAAKVRLGCEVCSWTGFAIIPSMCVQST